MKEFSILFYLDASLKRYQDTVKNVFTKADSLFEIRRKKTIFKSLEDPNNGDYVSEFPFLFNTVFEKVMYSICIKCSAVSYDKNFEKKMKGKKQMKWKISEIFAKENTQLSQLKTPLQANTSVNEDNANTDKGNKVVSENFQRNKNYSKENKLKVEAVKRKNVVKMNKKTYLHLQRDEPVLDNAFVLGEIYYSKHFGKKFKLNKHKKTLYP